MTLEQRCVSLFSSAVSFVVLAMSIVITCAPGMCAVPFSQAFWPLVGFNAPITAYWVYGLYNHICIHGTNDESCLEDTWMWPHQAVARRAMAKHEALQRKAEHERYLDSLIEHEDESQWQARLAGSPEGQQQMAKSA